MNFIYTSLFGLICIAIGHFLSRRIDIKRQLETFRATAYADFISGTASLALTQRDTMHDKEHWDEARKHLIFLTAAKARIAIYGSEEVIAKLAAFFRAGGALQIRKNNMMHLPQSVYKCEKIAVQNLWQMKKTCFICSSKWIENISSKTRARG